LLNKYFFNNFKIFNSILTNQQAQQLYQNFFDTSYKVQACVVDYNTSFTGYPAYSVKSIQQPNTCSSNTTPSPSGLNMCINKRVSMNLIYLVIITHILIAVNLL